MRATKELPPTTDEMAKKLWKIVSDGCDDMALAISIASLDSGDQAAGAGELAAAWAEHKELEAELISKTQEPGGGGVGGGKESSEEKGTRDQMTTEQAESAFRVSTRRLCRALKKATWAAGEQAQKKGETQPGVSLSATSKAFLELVGLVGEGTFEALTTLLEEDARRRAENDAAAQGLARAEGERDGRQAALRDAKAGHAKDTEQRAALAQKLRDEIAEVEQAAQVETRVAMNEAKLREANEAKAAKEREAAFLAEREKLVAALEAKAKEHKRKEHELRKRKQRTEQEAQNWIRRYDGEMGELEASHTGVEGEYSKEKEELDAAEQEAAKLTAERDELVAEENRRAQLQARDLERRRHVDDAAKAIQRCWRRHRSTTKPAGKGRGGEEQGKRSKSRQGAKTPSTAATTMAPSATATTTVSAEPTYAEGASGLPSIGAQRPASVTSSSGTGKTLQRHTASASSRGGRSSGTPLRT